MVGGKMIIAVLGIVLIGTTVGYSAFNAMIPVNGKFPVLGAPENTYLQTKLDPSAGFVFVSQSTTSGKKSIGSHHVSPVIHVGKDQLASLHVINEDRTSKHNLNVDEFNVHTKDLGYFETQTTLFLADKSGTFRYYCSLHPEMNGELIVQ